MLREPLACVRALEDALRYNGPSQRDGLFGHNGPFGANGPFGRRGPFGHRGRFGHRGPFGHRGLFGHRGPFGHYGPFGLYGPLGAGGLLVQRRRRGFLARPWRRRRYSRTGAVLLGLLLIGIVILLMRARGEQESNWI